MRYREPVADFRLSAEHQRFADWARETAAEKVAPLARHDGRVNRPLLRAMGDPTTPPENRGGKHPPGSCVAASA